MIISSWLVWVLLVHVTHTAEYVNVALEGTASQSSTGGGAYEGKYLYTGGWKGSRRIEYSDLATALAKCKTKSGCNGVTKENGKFSLRRGTTLKNSNHGEISWFINPQLSEKAGASRAVDGNISQDYDKKSCTQTASNSGDQWWEVDLGKVYAIDHVLVYGRTDCCTNEYAGAEVYIGPHLCGTLVDHGKAGTSNRIKCSDPKHMKGRKVTIKHSNGVLSICEVVVNVKKSDLEAEYSTVQPTYTEVAKRKPTKQSSTAYGGVSSRGVDGKISANAWKSKSCTHTDKEALNWWEVDLETEYPIDKIEILGRDSSQDRLENALVLIDGKTVAGLSYYDKQENWVLNVGNVTGRVVRVTNMDNYLTVCEVQVFVNNYYEQPKWAKMTNLAHNRPAISSSQKYGGSADLVVDGNPDGSFFRGSCMLTAVRQGNAWWKVHLHHHHKIGKIVIYSRVDTFNHHRKNYIDSAEVRVGTAYCGTITYTEQLIYTLDCGGAKADSVSISKLGILSICEVMVYAPA